MISPLNFPLRFELHYSEGWRLENEARLKDTDESYWNRDLVDVDLSAHLVITKKRGICICGEDIAKIIPDIPRSEYIKSILYDYEAIKENIYNNPVYNILNTCRVIACMENDIAPSKLEGGTLMKNRFPDNLKAVIEEAINVYAEVKDNFSANCELLGDFWKYTDYIIEKLKAEK